MSLSRLFFKLQLFMSCVVVDVGTISPLDQVLPPSSFTSFNLLFPSACAVIVMSVILLVAFLVICKKRPVFDDPMSSLQHHEQMCSVIRSDDPRRRSCIDGGGGTNTLPGVGMLSLLERKESCLNGSPNKIYFPYQYQGHLHHTLDHRLPHHHEEVVLVTTTSNPSPCKHHQQHSSSNSDPSHVQSQSQGISLQILESSSSSEGGGGISCQTSSGQPVTFERLNMDHHTYDIPFPPKWV